MPPVGCKVEPKEDGDRNHNYDRALFLVHDFNSALRHQRFKSSARHQLRESKNQ
jgi:predicted RNA binding protein with dsRBD fold (UPF0201 family)